MFSWCHASPHWVWLFDSLLTLFLPPGLKDSSSSKTASCSTTRRASGGTSRATVSSTSTPRLSPHNVSLVFRILHILDEPCWVAATLTYVLIPQGVIPLGGCVVSANENLGMPFAIVVNLEDFTVSVTAGPALNSSVFFYSVDELVWCTVRVFLHRAPSYWLQSRRRSRSSGWRWSKSREKCTCSETDKSVW